MSTSFETTLERVKDEIRAEAEAIRQRLPQARAIEPAAVVPAPIAGPVAGNGTAVHGQAALTVDSLCSANYARFVEEAFRAVIGRDIEADTRSQLVRRLAAGASKVEILGDLRYSPEGRAQDVGVAGLRPAYLLAKLFKVPVVGYLAEWLFRLARLPIQARQQRAAETYLAGREHEAGLRMGALARQGEALVAEQVALSARLQALLGSDAAALKEIITAQRGLANEIEALSRRLGALADDSAGGVRRVVAMHDALAVRIDEVAQRAGDGNRDYHRLVLGMNHWLAALRTNLAELESAESASPRDTD
ncbi:MAG: hypothetical protein J0L88_05755 [Xanthomonadales bacterium]|nr:hypothetical protein [Xanthomonadales bacterium]